MTINPINKHNPATREPKEEATKNASTKSKQLRVIVPPIKSVINTSPGFAKKQLADYKLDILALCEFGCSYCSSNMGNYLRINQQPFAELTEQQLGVRLLPVDEPALTFHYPDVIGQLERFLATKRKSWGRGKTLVFSMLTDGFSPTLVAGGITKKALQLVLERTSFRIRVLTKNAVVGTDKWIEFFLRYPGRFVVGLSTGTLDDDWARKIEIATSSPSARLRSLGRLQAAGVPTFGMLCPVFPHTLGEGRVEELIDRINPAAVETVWAEPYNDRTNWEAVRNGYPPGSRGYEWLTQVYEHQDYAAWSEYATELYVRLRDKAVREGWVDKLAYLLYEGHITATDAPAFAGLKGVLLQSKPGEDGRSQNEHIAALQAR